MKMQTRSILGGSLIAFTTIVASVACSEPEPEHPQGKVAETTQESWEAIMFYDEWNDPVEPGFQCPRNRAWVFNDLGGRHYEREVWIVATCEDKAWLSFNTLVFLEPTQQDHQLTTDRDGEYYSLPARIDGDEVKYSMVEHSPWAWKVHFGPGEDARFLREIRGGSTVKFMQPTQGEDVLFEWPLTGYAEAREEACGQQ